VLGSGNSLRGEIALVGIDSPTFEAVLIKDYADNPTR
jgi:hypothetical protein